MSGCYVSPDALQNAINAHAAGVLIDITRRDGLTYNAGSACSELVGYNQHGNGFQAPPIPWVTLPPPQAQALENLVQKQPVSITVTGHSNPNYFYVVATNYERTMPTSVTRTVTAKDLATENMTIDTAQAGQEEAPEFDTSVWSPNIGVGIGSGWIPNRPSLPFHATVYVSTGQGQDTDVQLSGENIHYSVPAAGIGSPAVADSAFQRNVMPTMSSTTTVDYGREPFTIGAQTLPSNFGALQYGLEFCDVCRQGNDFIPAVDDVSGATPDGATATGLLITGQLTSNGVALPQDSLGVGWTLPPQSAPYELTSHTTDADYAWTFTSAAPTADKTPGGTICVDTLFASSTDACTSTPLVFVRYAAPVDATNQAPSYTKQTLTITAYHAYNQGPAITALTQQVSLDGGKTWTMARVSPGQTAGTYTATYTVPPLAQTDGFVSLRTTATDAAGNTTDQTYRDSYTLT